MFRRDSRWGWLTLFALVNLLLWAGVAAAFGLVVSDRVDLGVEALARRGQATAVALWSQVIPRAAQPTPVPTALVGAPSPTEIVENTPQATATEAHGSQPSAPATAPTPDDTPTPEPEATGVRTPLLLADPEISSLAALNAEMSRSAPNRAVQIRYQEEALNREIAVLSTNNPDLPFRDVYVDLQRNRVVVTGETTVLGFQVSAEVTGSVSVQECRPQLEIETVFVAGVMTPQFVKDQVEEMVLEAMDWYPVDYPLCLEQIVLEETRATVYGYRR
ncbi:MAG: hypothetical protein P8189_04290 [Anaerolineae bacterium]|jgi:hypothetical protein